MLHGRVVWPNDQAVPTAGAGASMETGRRVKAKESMADRAAPAVGTSALFALVCSVTVLMVLFVQVQSSCLNRHGYSLLDFDTLFQELPI
jgi:hypothetical protein